jgi:hypothetical protein
MSHEQLGLTRFTTTWGEATTFPPYNIICASPRSPHPNGILSWDSQMGVLKLPKLGLPQLWGPITSHANLGLRWGLKQSYSSHQDFFNGMYHATFTQVNRVDSRLLVIGNQTANLTPGLFFNHNLCLKCPNGSCEPILDIYGLISFQWYK